MSHLIMLVATIYSIVNIWILWWFWRRLKGSGAIRWIVCFCLAALMAFFPVFYPHGNSSGAPLERLALRAGAFWIGSYLYLFFIIVIADVIGLWKKRSKKPAAKPNYKLAFGALALTALISFVGWINASFPVVNETHITVKAVRDENGQLPKPITIAAFTDLHIGRINGVGTFSRAIDALLPYKPDVVVFLGDVLDDHIAVDEAGIKREIARLHPPLGVWGILGNHEYISGPIETSINILERNGIPVLRDEFIIADERIVIVGRDDYSQERFTGAKRKTLGEILQNRSTEQTALPVLILDHQPYHLEEAEHAGATLQLSGHTHNGQIWPFNLIIAKVYENGLGYSRRGDTHYIVSAGTGTWGPPIRNNGRPEVVLVHLDFSDE